MIVAVNTHPEEDDFVMPFLKNNKYGFLPLKSPKEWASKEYNIRGTPTNFLIGLDGRVFFQPRVHDKESQRALELQVEALLGQIQDQKSSD